jgi:copper(I)-binding protein
LKKATILFIILALALAGCSSGTQTPAAQAGIEVTQARVFLPGGDPLDMGAGTLAGYMTIKNSSAVDDRLTSVLVDFAFASLHETKMEGDIMKMGEVKGIDIPAGGTVELKSGGYHIMFTNPIRMVKVGESVQVVLQFEKGGNITIQAPVTDK